MAKAEAKTYHHGDLRRALLDAAEAELSEHGRGGFSLRKIALRVGVSHSAPAHHFGDVSGLIDALAERGFLRLLSCMERRQASAVDDHYERLIASGLGYIDFALGSPALFRLVFGLDQKPSAGGGLQLAGARAFQHLENAVNKLPTSQRDDDRQRRAKVLACWTRVHGYAELLLSGYVDLGSERHRNDEIESLFRDLFEAEFH